MCKIYFYIILDALSFGLLKVMSFDTNTALYLVVCVCLCVLINVELVEYFMPGITK